MYKTDPNPIWMALARFGQTHLVWKQAVVQELSGPVSGRTQPAPLPVSRFQIRFRSSTDVPDNTVQNQPGSGLILTDCVRFWPNGSGPEASRCAGIIRPASGPCFPADPDRMRIGSGMFTESVPLSILHRKTNLLARNNKIPIMTVAVASELGRSPPE